MSGVADPFKKIVPKAKDAHEMDRDTYLKRAPIKSEKEVRALENQPAEPRSTRHRPGKYQGAHATSGSGFIGCPNYDAIQYERKSTVDPDPSTAHRRLSQSPNHFLKDK